MSVQDICDNLAICCKDVDSLWPCLEKSYSKQFFFPILTSEYSHLFDDQNQSIIDKEVDKVKSEAKKGMDSVLQKHEADMRELNAEIYRVKNLLN